MVKFSLFSLLALPTVFSMTRGGTKNKIQSRHLSFEKIGNYQPDSSVTDHNAIDLDQAAMERQLAMGTDQSYAVAKAIYQEGGHSKSYASITLTAPLSSGVSKSAPMVGFTDSGTEVRGKAYSAYDAGATEVRFQYAVSDVQESYVNCQVGALSMAGEENIEGCIGSSGTVTIDGMDYGYGYDQLTDNNNGRTIQGFSTAAEAKMYSGCPGCPYPAYKEFYDYYGEFDYANQWVLAAMDGTATDFTNGNADFSKYTFSGREQCIKKGTSYMNVYMYVIREFYDAIDDCQTGCINCNDDPVHAWDEGVAFFTGSMESKLVYTLGQKRCGNFKTCGTSSEELEGTAKVNYDLFQQFAVGQFNLLNGNCAAAKVNADRIVDLMAVPVIQGTMRYAYKVDRLQGAEKEAAEGAVFAAAVLPKLHACNEDHAQIVYDNMMVGATSTSFVDVKTAFESNYECLGITCADVGGLHNDATMTFYDDAEPCVDKSNADSSTKASPIAIGLGSAGAAVGVIALMFVGYMVSREKEGKPVFEASSAIA